jgi:hypothetical protein
MKVSVKGNVAEIFAEEIGRMYWNKCFKVCPICGGELVYTYKGGFIIENSPLLMPDMVKGEIRKGTISNIELRNENDPYIYHVSARCKTIYDEYWECPFRLDFDKHYEIFTLIESGFRINGLQMSEYLDSLVDRYNNMLWRPGYQSKLPRLDKSTLYWRINNLPINGRGSHFGEAEKYVELAYALSDSLRVAKQKEENDEYGKQKEAERLGEIEKIILDLIPELKVLWNTKDTYNCDKEDWKADEIHKRFRKGSLD